MRNVLPAPAAAALAALARGNFRLLRRVIASGVAAVGWHLAGRCHVTGRQPASQRNAAAALAPVRRAGRATAVRQPAGAGWTTGTRAAGRSPWRFPKYRPRPRPAGSARCSSTRAGPAAAASAWPPAWRTGWRRRWPRGTTSSDSTRGASGPPGPALHCDPSFFAGARPDYIPASKAAEQVLVGRARAYAADCGRKYGWLLPHLTTQDTARDIDSIRAALGATPDQLLRLLLRHLHRPGVRDHVPEPGPPDGAGQHGRPHRGLVRGQHRPGLRVPGPAGRVLLLDRLARWHFRAAALPGRR